MCIRDSDETNLADDPKAKRVLVRCGCKYTVLVRNHSKSATSIMMCGNGAGLVLPPYVVYKAKNMWEAWLHGGPPGSRYNCTTSGWFDEATSIGLRQRSCATFKRKEIMMGKPF